MDYRATESYARRIEAEALRRAQGLRREAFDDFWRAVAGLGRSAWRALRRRLARPSRVETLFPEA